MNVVPFEKFFSENNDEGCFASNVCINMGDYLKFYNAFKKSIEDGYVDEWLLVIDDGESSYSSSAFAITDKEMQDIVRFFGDISPDEMVEMKEEHRTVIMRDTGKNKNDIRGYYLFWD